MLTTLLFFFLVANTGGKISQVSETRCATTDCRLFEAARRGDLLEVQALVRSGANVNPPGGGDASPLFAAIGSRRTEVALFLIAAGADVSMEDSYGMTPLIAAAFSGQEGVVKELLNRKADPNHGSKHGYTALMSAAKYCAECIEVLLDRGALVDAAADEGETALTEAAYAGNLKAVQILVEAGADVHHQTAEGLTALQIARDRLRAARQRNIRLDGQHREIIRFLESAMRHKRAK